MTIPYVVGELLVAAMMVAGILMWDNKRLDGIEKRHRDKFRRRD